MKKVKHNSLLLKCGLCTTASLQRVERKKKNFTAEKTDKHYLSQVLKMNIKSNVMEKTGS